MMDQMGVPNLVSLSKIIRTRHDIESLVGTNLREEISIRNFRLTLASIKTILSHVRFHMHFDIPCLDCYSSNAQEVGNPEVRLHLIFYPDDGAKRYRGPWHADHWVREVPRFVFLLQMGSKIITQRSHA